MSGQSSDAAQDRMPCYSVDETLREVNHLHSGAMSHNGSHVY